MHADDYLFERQYWGDCCNTFDEDQKHYVYARCMNIQIVHYHFLVGNKRILDIGGGPTSMLLKVQDLKEGKVVDPISYPRWTLDRYTSKNISVDVDIGENVNYTDFDEVWIYNCMQHAVDPEKIISNAKRAAPVLRLFEWIDVPAHEGHPHELTESNLNEWISSRGSISYLSESGCYGKAYHGVFTR